ncbi:Uncharacterised protein [BD1-7 clade bacterium]|nr:Uncharacterised protein [BD1-7 clade bacterium]
MPFITCSNCHNQIDSKINSCPHCGEMANPCQSKYDYNLWMAEQAIDYVHNTIQLKPFNRAEGINKFSDEQTSEYLHELVDGYRVKRDSIYSEKVEQMKEAGLPCNAHQFERMRLWTTASHMLAQSKEKLDYNDRMLKYAGFSKKYGAAGNCFEHAAVAFSYLAGKGVRNIAHYCFEEPLDHHWLVFNTTGKPLDIYRYEVASSCYPKEWQGAVYCDPWASVFFVVDDSFPKQYMRVIGQRNRRGGPLNDGYVCTLKCLYFE